jgi:predicted DNA-binding transcriptional regulator AlpA
MRTPVAANDNQPSRFISPVGLPPRGLRREAAAEYLGISVSSFDLGVKDGTFPPPRRFRGRVIWDRLALDSAFDELPSDDFENPWDKALAS